LDHVEVTSFVAGPELDAKLRAAIADARVYWPEIRVSDEVVLAHMARAIERGSAPTIDEWLTVGTVGDLYLAYACAAGDAAALAAFESHYMAKLDGALRRLGIEQGVIDEAKQNVRIAILVGEGERPPRIADYSGRGKLDGWLRVITINAARRILRVRGNAVETEEVSFEALDADSPHRDLEFLKESYRENFKLAFQSALEGLSARERTLLRQHYMLGMTIDQLSTIYAAHRATCARWIEKCRDTLYKQTRDTLVRSLQVDRAEFESIWRLIESHFDVSVRRYLDVED
jgi:RNA polymerase sigma-70 factor (ECF subfamily)